MEFTNIAYRHHPQPLSLITRRPRPRPRPSFISIEFSKSTSFSLITPKASFRDLSYKTPRHPITKLVNPTTLSFLKTTFVVATIFVSRFTVEPAIAAPPPATVEEILEEEYHIKALKTLIENKIKKGKIQEAVRILDRLVNLDSNKELKYYLHLNGRDAEESVNDPLRLEANSHANELLKNMEKVTRERMEVCARWRKMRKMEHYDNAYRDFKLILAQISLTRGDYNDALKIYQEILYEHPRDFKPYFMQGVIYTMLGKYDDAEYNFGIVEKIYFGRLRLITDYIQVACGILVLAFQLWFLYEIKFKW